MQTNKSGNVIGEGDEVVGEKKKQAICRNKLVSN